jgi:hypothetical protein
MVAKALDFAKQKGIEKMFFWIASSVATLLPRNDGKKWNCIIVSYVK